MRPSRPPSGFAPRTPSPACACCSSGGGGVPAASSSRSQAVEDRATELFEEFEWAEMDAEEDWRSVTETELSRGGQAQTVRFLCMYYYFSSVN